MARSLVSKEVLPFAKLLGGLVVATIVLDAILHQFELLWIGRYLGIPGTLLILLSFVYSLRKRRIITFGKPKTLLTIHQILTMLGALMILVHAGVHRSIKAALSGRAEDSIRVSYATTEAAAGAPTSAPAAVKAEAPLLRTEPCRIWR